jgi:Uma2 family endonuclease
MTVDDLLAWPDDDGYRYELVEGTLVRMAGSGKRATRIGLRLGARLLDYVEGHGLGVVTGADGVYKFPGAATGLVPDAGFYTRERDALIPAEDEDRPIPFAPDLAVEVASPSQGSDAMAAKTRTYLAGGTRLVWVVWPARRQIDVWHAGDVAPTTLSGDATLDGEAVVPGFRLRVADLFA